MLMMSSLEYVCFFYMCIFLVCGYANFFFPSYNFFLSLKKCMYHFRAMKILRHCNEIGNTTSPFFTVLSNNEFWPCAIKTAEFSDSFESCQWQSLAVCGIFPAQFSRWLRKNFVNTSSSYLFPYLLSALLIFALEHSHFIFSLAFLHQIQPQYTVSIHFNLLNCNNIRYENWTVGITPFTYL